jgi:hypothetical protein
VSRNRVALEIGRAFQSGRRLACHHAHGSDIAFGGGDNRIKPDVRARRRTKIDFAGAAMIVTANGDTYSAGDIDYSFSIQSVSKPFVAALSDESPRVRAQALISLGRLNDVSVAKSMSVSRPFSVALSGSEGKPYNRT